MPCGVTSRGTPVLGSIDSVNRRALGLWRTQMLTSRLFSRYVFALLIPLTISCALGPADAANTGKWRKPV